MAGGRFVTRLVPDPAPPPARLMNIANALTLMRLALVPVFAVALLEHDGKHTGWRVAACVIFAMASITDRIDGDLARRRNLVTEFGKMIDPIADKALIGTALVGLSVLDILPWWVTLLVVGREIFITLLRLWVIRRGVIPASRGGKIKTFVQAVAIGLYLLPLPHRVILLPELVMAVAVLLTMGTGIDYVFRIVSLRRRPVVG
jgi:CDP-diacylglycerol--glycerol-3-phosphate 3-phosphatidyltransferase